MDASTVVRGRLILAGCSLGAFAVLVVVVAGGEGGVELPGRSRWPIWLLLLPLGLTALALARRMVWGRWGGLAIGVAVTPWALALTLGPTYGQPVTRQAVALAVAIVLVLSLLGRSMFEAFEGRATKVDWSGRRMALVRWTIVANLASALSLYLFVTQYDYASDELILIPAIVLCGLLIGVMLLAHQKTVGLLVLGLACIAFVPSGAYFVWREAQDLPEALLFAVLFAPGVLLGWACLVAFGIPAWRYLRTG